MLATLLIPNGKFTMIHGKQQRWLIIRGKKKNRRKRLSPRTDPTRVICLYFRPEPGPNPRVPSGFSGRPDPLRTLGQNKIYNIYIYIKGIQQTLLSKTTYNVQSTFVSRVKQLYITVGTATRMSIEQVSRCTIVATFSFSLLVYSMDG